MSWVDTKIAECSNWKEFRQLAESQRSEKDKGDLFERLTQLYLQTSSSYRTKFKNVWWCNKSELPEVVRKKLNLPRGDEGIDLVCETMDGKYWSVQSKYRTDSNRALNTKELSKFSSLSFVTGRNIEGGLIAHTSAKKVQKSELLGNSVEIGLQHWLAIDQRQWSTIIDICKGNTLQAPEKRDPRKHQEIAIEKVKKHFSKTDVTRGKLIMPCGTGKSLTAYWMAQELKAKTIVVAVPSLALVKQSLEDWTTEYLADVITPSWLAVCSDDSVGNMKEADSTVATVYEAGIPVTTVPAEIINFIKKKTSGPRVIFTTYQSSSMLAAACSEAKLTIDLLIADEAHKTVGGRDKKFGTLLFDENIKFKKRIFMTATERVYRQASDNIVSMDNPKIYGTTFYEMSFKEAIDRDIICDYKILTIAVTEREVSQLLEDHADVMAQLGNKRFETDAHNLAAGIAINKVFADYGVTHALSFHSSIMRAKNFAEQQDVFSSTFRNKKKITHKTISSKLSAGQRSQLMQTFVEDDLALMTNARCLTEGVDIPSIDCVTFVDPKQSIVDIVQASGRAMRQSKETGKEFGYILLPIIIPDGRTLEEFSQTTDFKSIARIITTLSTQDHRIVEQLRAKQDKRIKVKNDVIQIDPDVVERLDISYEELYEKISTQIWHNVGRANWRDFKSARKFVHSLKFKNRDDWLEYCNSGLRPPDIPSNPQLTYRFLGYLSMGDWLGTGNIAPQNRLYLDYEEASEIVKNYNLKTRKSFIDLHPKEFANLNIPYHPDRTYIGKGWISWQDFLGSNFLGNYEKSKQFLNFQDAKAYVQSLGISSIRDWRTFATSEKRPVYIPSGPEIVYKNSGWKGYGDFLGFGRRNRKVDFWTFKKAREFIHSLNLGSVKELRQARSEGKIPGDIPASPNNVYAEWVSWGDWLGTFRLADGQKELWSFEEARKFARGLGLQSFKQWREYLNTNPHPNLITMCDRAYKNKGWNGWGDFLGHENDKVRLSKQKLSYEEAKSFLKDKDLRSKKEYSEAIKKFGWDFLYYEPGRPFMDSGWTNWQQYLGYKKKRTKQRFIPFQDARNYSRKLGLTSQGQWRVWSAAGSRPDNIPSAPYKFYKKEGWAGWPDWLGYEAKPVKKLLPFKEARKIVHDKQFTSVSEFRNWFSKEKPVGIPYSPDKAYKGVGWVNFYDWLGKDKPVEKY